MQKFLLLILMVGNLTACKSSSSLKTEADTSIQLEKQINVLEDLRTHLSLRPANQPPLSEQKFSNIPLSQDQANQAIKLILTDRLATLRSERQREHTEKSITLDFGGRTKTLRYAYKTLGEKPADGHSLYISMHGGGGTTADTNDGQWRNQYNLYTPEEGIYVVPRAPTDTWNLWHLPHIDPLFDRLIENFIALEGINPNKVYIMGYSAGGDGTYQLAPRMADRWAAAAMMAGHPGDAQTYNLRNLPYFIQCGGKDAAYNRNKLAVEWGTKLEELAKKDPGGYPHKCIVYPQLGHWMKGQCRQAVPWMAKYTRNPWPKKLLWHQDNVTNTRFFWLSNENPKPNQLISAEVLGQTITLKNHATHQSKLETKNLSGAGEFAPISSITLRLSDQLINLDKSLIVKDTRGKILYQGQVQRTLGVIDQSLQQRPDPTSVATATLTIKLD